MARPNDAGAIANHVRGLREAKAVFQALPEVVRNRLNAATELTVREIARNAKAKVQASPSIRTRTLYDAIAWTMNTKNGRGRVGVSNVTSYANPLPGIRKNVKVKGRLIAGRGGSALTSEGARLVRPSRYAHLVEFGARHMPAEPFMIPSAEAQAQPYLERCRDRGRDIERDMANIGARYL